MAILNNLIVNGASRFLNKAYFSFIKTDRIGAEEGIFNKIVATTGDIGSLTVDDLTAGKATVLSLLDVRGELHTNQWTNSNIATVDGSFYITPTIGVNSGTMTTTANSVTVNGSNFPISSLYVNGINSDNTAGTVAWTSGSKVLVTGEILVNGTYMPLGTLVGTLGSNVTASKIDIINITDNRYQTAESLAEIGTQSTALPCRNVKISLYQTSRSSTLYPLGIFMTALGENGKTFLDIYGGGYATSTATAGGFARPVLRIGNLAGLPTIGTQTPTGYGIYTSNGYFSGTVAARKGIIGDGATAWTIGSGSGTGSVSYIYAPTSGPTSKTANTVGMYVGTDGINNFKTVTQYVRIYDGKIYAQGADITGTVNATSFSAEYYNSNNELKYQTSLDGYGLIVKDGSNNTLSQFGAETIIGRTSGDKYNINITNDAINLRYNETILNKIDDEGMYLYDKNSGIEIAHFLGSEARIGKEEEGHVFITDDEFQITDSIGSIMDITSSGGEIQIPTTYSSGNNIDQTKWGHTYTWSPFVKKSRDRGYYYRIDVIFFRGADSTIDSVGYKSDVTTTSTIVKKHGNANMITFLGTYYFPENSNYSDTISFAISYNKVQSTGGSTFNNITVNWNITLSWDYSTTTLTINYGDLKYGTGVLIDSIRAIGTKRTYENRNAPMYTIGFRGENTEEVGTPGGYSTSIGGGLIARKEYQTVIGTYNKNQEDTIFEIGNGEGEDEDSRSNALTVDWDGNVEAAGDFYSKVNQISLGTYITGGVLTNGSSDIHFSIPTGRVFPNGTTISKLTFNIVVRAGNSNASGMYIVKSASGGTDVKYYDSTASFQFYNGANQSKTLTTAMSTIVLQGGTNIDVHWLGSGNYFFSGSSTYNGYVNNQPVVIMLTNINVTLNFN